MKHILTVGTIAVVALAVPVCSYSQTSLESSLSYSSRISPYYFGPQAFPVPDMVDRVSGDLRIELAGDIFAGYRGDMTCDLMLKANIPLFTHRVNLSLWMPVREWYRNTDRNMDVCRIPNGRRDQARCGSLTGDVYVSVDIQLLEEKLRCPDFTLRAALKTASGDGYSLARYYDSPGYFFDATVAKSFNVWRRYGLELRFAVNAGFLCWQTDNGRQNDAPMFGVKLGLRTKRWAFSEIFGGYAGWEGMSCEDGALAHDCPMVLTSELSYRIADCWEIAACYQHGLHDYPYNQFRIGVAWHFDVLHR